ncbi:MAG: hypothetical protein ACI89E_002448, partial [Planctomycetota bacterium]
MVREAQGALLDPLDGNGRNQKERVNGAVFESEANNRIISRDIEVHSISGHREHRGHRGQLFFGRSDL